MKSFNYFSPKNILITLAALLVVAMGYMAIKTYKKPFLQKPMTYEQQVEKIESQSDSDSIESIEKDLNETDLEASDKELMDIETELNAETSY